MVSALDRSLPTSHRLPRWYLGSRALGTGQACSAERGIPAEGPEPAGGGDSIADRDIPETGHSGGGRAVGRGRAASSGSDDGQDVTGVGCRRWRLPAHDHARGAGKWRPRRSAGQPDARLRVAIAERRGSGFAYDSRSSPGSDRPADPSSGTPHGVVFVAARDQDHLRGATIGLDTAAFGGAIAIDNPNSGWTDPLAQRIQEILDTQVNPGIAAHGGFIDLLEVRDATAYISMGGGCVGCAQVDVTLRQGVEVAIRQAVPEIVAIVDTTDHASGTNPYYQPAKK